MNIASTSHEARYRCAFDRAPVRSIAAAAIAISAAAFVGAWAMIYSSPVSAAVDERVFRCVFTNGEVRIFDQSAFERRPATDLTFDIGRVDLSAQTATLYTGGGEAQLRIVRAINANHFLEVVTQGYLNMTTIYQPLDGTDRAPAVHSRHIGLSGRPFVSQYTGFCEPVEPAR
ncbi:MAG: hypothetical protein ACFCUN_08690 [Hyphomicrobiaceae bacterium]